MVQAGTSHQIGEEEGWNQLTRNACNRRARLQDKIQASEYHTEI
jgi:hypothetical protein